MINDDIPSEEELEKMYDQDDDFEEDEKDLDDDDDEDDLEDDANLGERI